MRVEIKKVADGRPSLACIRDDGSRSWSRTHPFFPVHDLTHFAVESVLGLDQAFYGLIRSGWEIDDFLESGVAARLPAEAMVAECIVGQLDLERGTGPVHDAAAFNEALTAALAKHGIAETRVIDSGELDAIRSMRDRLTERWLALPPGDTLVLTFPGRSAA